MDDLRSSRRYARFELALLGPDAVNGLQDLGPSVDGLDDQEKAAAKALVRTRLADETDPLIIRAARLLYIADAPALLRAHLAGSPDAPTGLRLCEALLVWDGQDEDAVGRLVAYARFADPASRLLLPP